MIEQWKLPNSWEWVTLGEVCEINPRKPSLACGDDEPTTFVPMAAVDDNLGAITDMQTRPFSEVKKGYTYFEENDVLFAKITPCMENGKICVATDLLNGFGFGTTEFHVLRANSRILPTWVYHYVRQASIRELATTFFTGAVGQQRVPKEFLMDLPIPLPPLSEQKRIAAIVDEQMQDVEQARQAILEELAVAEAMAATYLRDVFESEEAQGWERVKLGKIASVIQNGIYKKSEFYGHGHPFIRMYNVQNTSWHLILDRLALVFLERDELSRYRLNCGNLLVSRVNSFELVGKTALVDEYAEGYVFENMLIRIELKDAANPMFIAQQMNSKFIREQIEGVAKKAIGQASINSTDLRNLELCMPPVEQQRQIAEYIEAQIQNIDLLRQLMKERLEAIEAMPAAILRRAFSGGY